MIRTRTNYSVGAIRAALRSSLLLIRRNSPNRVAAIGGTRITLISKGI